MDVAIVALSSGLLILNIFFCLSEMFVDLGVFSPRRLASVSGIFLALVLFILAAGARIPLRGGYDNEHDFGFMAESFSFSSQKELSAVPVKLFTDSAGRGQLGAHTVRNAVLLALDAGLVAAALIRTGAAPAAGAFAGLLLLFNFLALLNARTFSSTLANVFFLLSGVYALAALLFSEKLSWRNLAWAGCAALGVLGARFEFLPALAAGFAVALIAGGAAFRGRLAAAWRSRPAASAVSWGLFLALAAGWTGWLVSAVHYNGPAARKLVSAAEIVSNFVYHIGEKNISVFSGLPPALAAAAALLLFLPVFAGRKPAPGSGRHRFWAAWTLIWALCFSAVYMKLDLYPLHFMRHDLYFFLPFVFAAGGAADAVLGFFRGAAAKYAVFAGAALLAVYAAANLRAAYALNGELRTNDREWQFLVKARRAWPAGCVAVYPFENVRAALLDRYFPSPRPGAGEGQCVMAYKSPSAQVLRKVVPRRSAAAGRTSEETWPAGMAAGAFMEEKFPHAFYTIWHSGRAGDADEIMAPVPVTAGFYRLTRNSAKNVLAGIFRAEQVHEVLLKGLKLQGKGDFPGAVAVFSKGIDEGLCDAALYNARGVALVQKGDIGAAVCSLNLALQADPGFGQARSALYYITHKYGGAACKGKESGR